jgi:hypothetical protein
VPQQGIRLLGLTCGVLSGRSYLLQDPRMPIELHCDGCARTLRVADTLAGKTVKCPHCQTRKVVPGGAAALTPAPRRAAAASPGRAAPVRAVARSPARPAARARPGEKVKPTVPWFMYLIGALPLGILALAVYHGAVGSGPPWGGSMRFVWLGLGSGSIILVMNLARLPSVPIGIKVGVGLAVGVLDYVVVAAVLLANRPADPDPPPEGNRAGGQQAPAKAQVGEPPPVGGRVDKPTPPAAPPLPAESGPFRAHVKPLRWMALSPGGETLATAGADGFVMLWDVSTGKRTGGFKAHEGGAGRVAFSADGKLLATLGTANEAQLRVWGVGEAQPRFSRDNPGGTYAGLVLLQDGRLVATTGGKVLHVFEVLERRDRVNSLFSDPVRGLALAPDGKVLFLGEAQKRVLQVSTETWRASKVAFVSRHGFPQELAVSPDGTYLAIAAPEGVDVIHLASTRRRRDFDKLPKAPVAHVSFSPDSKRLAFVQGGTAIVWDLPGIRRLTQVSEPSGIEQALFHPDGVRLIVRSGSEIRVHPLPH